MKTGRTGPILLCLGLLISCARENALDRIREKGSISVLTRNNAHCYYTYRDAPMGFEYDLARAFSRYAGVKLKVVTPPWEGLMSALDQGKGDFIAASMSITPSRAKRVAFSRPYLTVRQMVIIHKSHPPLKRIRDLAGETIHVRKGTTYAERLAQLKRRGLDIRIRLYDDIPTEELIEMVARKEIEMTIADSNIALLNRRYFPDVRVSIAIEKPQSLAWAVKKGETALLTEINRFFEKIKEDGTFDRIYRKYYAAVEVFDYLDLKKYHRRLETRLPRYEKIIRRAAGKYGFDWRLIAAVIYQESHFDPEARSFTGVEGLMQLTRDTASDMEIEDRTDPEQSIMAGVKYLRRLYDKYTEASDPDRLYITLASYNVGRSHVLDAQELARKMGLNPNSWSALERTLPLLRESRYYRKTRHGYCRGTEPVRYVNRILTYYDILKREAVDRETGARPTSS
ncbi:MAG: membrane-bound lytic murein transglycosylase MltF [Deltaproteobacteria bacterium]|nr:MAG: membrane-bound lytic murein transglycosylase MltF [Deltaproteobacteria bacterium]